MDPTHDFPADPREPDLLARRQWLQRLAHQQRLWLQRLAALAEPVPEDDFPAFLLATPAFAGLSNRLTGAAGRRDLATAVQDEVDHFVDAFRDYLRTDKGEQVFDRNSRRAG